MYKMRVIFRGEDENPPGPLRASWCAIKSLFSSPYLCLRCKATPLRLHETYGILDRVDFYICPRCQWRFAKRPGRALCDRWLSPLSLVLYKIIFEENPSGRAAEVAAEILRSESREEAKFIRNEILNELKYPTQQVRDILELSHEEQVLREYLRLVADRLGEGMIPDGIG